MDFSAVEVTMRRRNVEKQSAKVSDTALSRRQLEADGRYTAQDIEELIARKTAEGAYIADPNFPSRVDLRRYVINTEVAANRERLREDSSELTSRSSLNGQEALPLTEQGADFSYAAAPGINALIGFAYRIHGLGRWQGYS